MITSFRIYFTRMFSFNTGLALKRCDYVRFSVRLWLSYGSDELVQSGEMNQFT